MWIKNYVSATFHRQGIFKYKVLIILFTPYSPFSSRKVLALIAQFLLCTSAMPPLWLRFFHILRYHQLPRHCLVEDNPLLVGKLGKSKLGIFMYAHLLFQVNNKYNIYIIFIIIYIILIIRNIPCTHWKKQFAQFAFCPICPVNAITP